MSTYYYYYLEQKENDVWKRLMPINKEPLETDETIYWHSGSFGSDFVYNYKDRALDFYNYAKEDIDKYRDAYEKAKNGGRDWENYYPEYYLMDLETMIEDFNNNIHEYSGIISVNDSLKLKRDSCFEPEIILPRDFNKLSPEIKKNYMYYAWDSPWSEYGHIYDIIPIVNEMIEYYKLKIENVRLIYEIC